MSQMTLLTGPERRRRWSADDQRRILLSAFAPGAVVRDVSRQYDVATSLIYKWRRQALAARGEAMFSPVVLAEEPARVSPPRSEAPAIVVELAGGARVSIAATASAALIAATLRALR